MTLIDIAKKLEKLAVDNSPAILTAIGITGTVTTAYLTGKASVKAHRILEEQRKTIDDMTVREETKLVWKVFAPPVVSGAATITCIICATRIGTRRAAAMAAAYSVSEKAWAEYKEKVVEKLGHEKEEKIRAEVAQNRIDKNPVSTREVIITGGGDVLCYDSISGRYFQSNVETLRRAQNDINQQILTDMFASLYDFYNKIGLPTTPYSNEVGWNADVLLELEFSTVLAEDGRPCISLEYRLFPIRGYDRLA